MKLNSNHEIIEDIDFSDLENSGVPCPRCQIMMLIYFEGQTDEPDNDVSWLVCPNCKYSEKE